jgi:hypothetical protein
MGNDEKVRVIPTPSNPGGLDPAQHMSLAAALQKGGYRTGMSGKWHLGINSKEQDRRFTPTAHGYESYLGAPYTNAPMCEMDSDGISQKIPSGPNYCFMTANDTVVQQPLRLQNFTSTITAHALEFLDVQAMRQKNALVAGDVPEPWYFLMAWFHVHTPLFTNRTNGGRSKGGKFGDNVEELDDSAGELMAALKQHGFEEVQYKPCTVQAVYSASRLCKPFHCIVSTSVHCQRYPPHAPSSLPSTSHRTLSSSSPAITGRTKKRAGHSAAGPMCMRQMGVRSAGSRAAKDRCCTALYCTVLYCPVMSCPVLSFTVLYCTALRCTALRCTAVNAPTSCST